ncbi:MAG: Chaperone protein HtpG [Alphaproteobacteria bacterium MarineAlpha5_Bin9]|nr:MAG: Chaperone protein HtpG [Alphaproteobacteria bacterium MarineAlpha5_Bin9]|tara:strand:- start:2496 stop:4361 length:1866 start_codon:yes stop_codon:yes gene_type:complete
MNETAKKNKEKLNFQAEVSKLLHLVANSLYSEREIFLRELISNSADACEKIRYLAIKKPGIIKKSDQLSIFVKFSKKNNLIIVEDNGIGMTKSELIENLGTIAKSGTNKFIEAMSKKQASNISTIGQFGVGFYSSFMIAEKVTVESLSAENKDSYSWESDGKNDFIIQKINKISRGTSIFLNIKKDAQEFLDIFKLRSIITKYSNYIPFPIYLKDIDKKENEEKINEGEPLWLKNKKDIKKDEYKQFYNNISFNFDEPLKTIHFEAEGIINYNSLIYIPSKQPMDLFNPERKNKIKLYVQKIFITDDCEEIIPSWLRFIPGVVDSKDISLNISREMLQNNPIISKIKKGLINKILSELNNLSEDNDKYLIFWKNFGSVIKEGLYDNNEYHEKLLNLIRFQTSEDDNYISLDEYIKKINKDQKEIFYFSSVEKNNIKNSPQLESFIDKKIPVILMTDAVDEFWIPNVQKYKNLNFKSITKGKVDLSKFSSEKEKHIKNSDISNEFNNLIDILKKELKENIKDVIVSERLTKSPLILIADEENMDINMEKLMKMHNKDMQSSKKILEINIKHPMIIQLSKVIKNVDKKKIANLILDQANILDGNTLSDPSRYIENLTDIFMKK